MYRKYGTTKGTLARLDLRSINPHREQIAESDHRRENVAARTRPGQRSIINARDKLNYGERVLRANYRSSGGIELAYAHVCACGSYRSGPRGTRSFYGGYYSERISLGDICDCR